MVQIFFGDPGNLPLSSFTRCCPFPVRTRANLSMIELLLALRLTGSAGQLFTLPACPLKRHLKATCQRDLGGLGETPAIQLYQMPFIATMYGAHPLMVQLILALRFTGPRDQLFAAPACSQIRHLNLMDPRHLWGTREISDGPLSQNAIRYRAYRGIHRWPSCFWLSGSQALEVNPWPHPHAPWNGIWKQWFPGTSGGRGGGGGQGISSIQFHQMSSVAATCRALPSMIELRLSLSQLLLRLWIKSLHESNLETAFEHADITRESNLSLWLNTLAEPKRWSLHVDKPQEPNLEAAFE